MVVRGQDARSQLPPHSCSVTTAKPSPAKLLAANPGCLQSRAPHAPLPGSSRTPRTPTTSCVVVPLAVASV